MARGLKIGGRREGFALTPALACHQTCKPGSVPHREAGRWLFIWGASYDAPRATNPDGLPGNRHERSSRRPYSVLLPVGFALPPLLPKTRCALTAPFHPYPSRRDRRPGGLLSVALSLGSPPPEVIRHRASKEPGLSSPPTGGAAIRPADTLNKGRADRGVKRSGASDA
jgi:hypothetical protein